MKLRWILPVIMLAAILPWFATAQADIPTIVVSGSFTATGATPWVTLAGQSTCTVTLGGTGTGLTIVPQGSAVQPPTTASAVTIANIGSGSMSANGVYANTSAISQYALTAIRLNVSAIASGTETYTIACSSGAPPAVASGTVLVSPIPLPVTVPTQAAGNTIPVAALCPSAAPAVIAGAYSCVIDSAGNLKVSTPAPAPTNAVGLVVAVTGNCPSAAPAAVNSTYQVTCDSSGNQNVRIAATATTVPVTGAFTPTPWTQYSTPSPTSTPIAVKASAGTLGGVRFYNGTVSTRYIGVYDLAAASVTLGTTVAKQILACPATTLCFLPLPPGGLAFATAITYLCGTALDNAGVVGTACGALTSSFLMIDYQYHPTDPCRAQPSFHLQPRRFTLLPPARCRGSGA